mgnify:CR=1 FL=1
MYLHNWNKLADWTPLASILFLALWTGCSRGPEVPDEKRSPFEGDQFEVVWVNPQILVSDSLVTLIRAERIDSLPIEPSNLPISKPASIGLIVTQPTCEVVVDLVDADLRLLYPLLLRELPVGFYKLTFNVPAIKKPPLPPGVYFLRAEYCSEVETALFTVD